VCFGPDEVGIRRLRALMLDLPSDSPAGIALGMYTLDDERRSLTIDVLVDTASTLRVIASLWMEKGKAFDADPPLRWEHPNRPEPSAQEEDGLTYEQIQSAITAALPRG
jgi:hypothetical protein